MCVKTIADQFCHERGEIAAAKERMQAALMAGKSRLVVLALGAMAAASLAGGLGLPPGMLGLGS